MNRERATGFTFTELLVCIPCVLVVLIMLVPAVREAKEKAKDARCRSNVRNLAMGMMLYLNDFDGHFPAAGKCGRNLENDWTWGGNVVPLPQTDPEKCQRVQIEKGVLWPYVMGMARVGPYGEPGAKGMRDEWCSSPDKNPYLCPTAGPVGRKRGLSYSMNARLEVSEAGGAVVGVRISEIKGPSRKILLVDESDLTLNDGYFDAKGEENKSPEVHLKHNGGANMAFCDGHVAWLEKKRALKIMGADSDHFFPSR